MKTSELRNIIREEIISVIKEAGALSGMETTFATYKPQDWTYPAPMDEPVSKKERIYKLVEQMSAQSPFGEWRGDFVIGPDSRFIPIRGMKTVHVHAIGAYPTIEKEVIEKYYDNYSYSYRQESLAGTDKIYEIMYEYGFVRGGFSEYGFWVAFLLKKIPNDSLMLILQFMKEKNIKKITVDSVHKKYYTNMTMDEFIEEFL